MENIRRAGEVAKLLVDRRLIVICSFISPYRAERDMVRALIGRAEFIEVFVDTPIDECERRDTKRLHARARSGGTQEFYRNRFALRSSGVARGPFEDAGRPEKLISRWRIVLLFRLFA